MMSQVAYTTPAASTMVLPASSSMMPVTTTQTRAPVQMPTTTYVYGAGSAQVPVYGSSVAVPQLYQQPAAAMPTVTYQAQPLTQDQLMTIFPMGAPSPSTFQPFSQPQYQYNFVDSASAFVPASVQGLPVAAPIASVAEPPASAGAAGEVAPGASSMMQETGGTEPPATTTAGPATSDTATASSGKKTSSKKASSSKKLSSKKKSKGCC
mmetsp:Transcript_3866/g.7792  ORF Transcript_3866/g.7792 Transcript_3866/m.7792 type:complete len:209 (+) Transcript_3866:22-648(+)